MKDLIGLHKELYLLYVKAAELYELETVIVKSDESYSLNIAYCGTHICQAYVSLHLVKLSNSDEEKVNLGEEKYVYDINKLEKTIKKHYKFASTGIFFSVFLLVYIVVAYAVNSLGIENLNLFTFTWGESNLPLVAYGCGVVVLLIMSIAVHIKAKVDNKRYNQLCKLKYYRNNISLLNVKESNDFNRIDKKEDKIAKSIDSFYQFYGGVALAGLSVAISLITYSLLSFIPIIPNSEKAFTDPYKNLVFAPACVCLLIGILRHKKTSFSVFSAVVLSMILSVVLIYLVGAGMIA